MREYKVCVDCKIDKHHTEYHKNGGKGTGIQSRCIPCMSEYKKKRYWSNRDTELAKLTISRNKPENRQQRKEYYEKNKEQYAERYKSYISNEEVRQKKLEYGRKLHTKNKDKINARKKEYHRRPEVKERQREIHRLRKENDVEYNIKRRLRFRIRHAVKYIKQSNFKKKSSLQFLGCSLEEFKIHIESRFINGMSWERLSEIHIDHIKPCAKFDLTKEEEVEKCFHYTNLQPLWAKDNFIKRDKYEEV